MRNRSIVITFLTLLLPTVLMAPLLVQPSNSLDSGRFAHSTANSGLSMAFYVNPAGSDATDGSASTPWATIQRAADVARPGVIIHVAPGTYMAAIKTTASGTSDARMTFLSDIKWGACYDASRHRSLSDRRGAGSVALDILANITGNLKSAN